MSQQHEGNLSHRAKSHQRLAYAQWRRCRGFRSDPGSQVPAAPLLAVLRMAIPRERAEIALDQGIDVVLAI